jgi:hypothetical protein
MTNKDTRYIYILIIIMVYVYQYPNTIHKLRRFIFCQISFNILLIGSLYIAYRKYYDKINIITNDIAKLDKYYRKLNENI